MSNEQKLDSVETNVQPGPESTQEQKDQYVARKAYEEVANDMHKFKSRYKEQAARATELEARLKSIEEATLMEQSRWKELYEREKAEKEKAEQIRQQERNLYLRSVKVSALKSELGGKIRDEYLQLADINAIEIKEDGSLSPDSVLSVANKFRQEHPMLVPSSESSILTSPAASNKGMVSQNQQKSIAEMSIEEKIALLSQMKENRS